MFEKEAEERAVRKISNFIPSQWGVSLIRTEPTWETVEGAPHFYQNSLAKMWQEGAEFGYNKANEWHKQEVDDIYDLISEDWSVRYFICIMKDKSRVTAIGNCDEGNNGGVSVNLFFEHEDEKYYTDDIVWWKEIILPELKESK